VKYLMTKQQVGAGWKLALAGDAPIYENTNALPRARLVAAAPVGAHSRAPNPLASCPVRWSRDAAHLVRLETDCPLPALLVLTDSYYPGWTATVDAEPVGIQLAERAFRAVAVPAGKHVVEFRYQPATYRIGLFVSLIACAALAAAATQAYQSRK
jgi:hypothetical protein